MYDVMFMNPEKSAELADLCYVSDEEPGITRQKRGKGFTYLDPDGKSITDKAERARIDAIGIPPAWTEVWICPDPDGHIQATGRDDAGRKQYRYHPRWNEIRQQDKFEHIKAFGEALPDIRKTVEKHLRQRNLSKEKVLAIVVRLLEETLIRIGNTAYAQQNDSYGLTTLQDEHVSVYGSQLTFEFRGKSGKEHVIDLQDARLAKLVKACEDIPGQHLFQYFDENGEPRPLHSGDVNSYLREITGQEFSAKDFRTWGGSVLAVKTLLEMPAEDEATMRKNIVAAIKQVAEGMGNTVAVCRQYYIHPRVLEAYENNELFDIDNPQVDDSYLSPAESLLLALL
jgi:DNA topoisomerase-1